MSDQICLIHTSVADKDAAERIARQLVEQHLAACVQISGPGISIYRWHGDCEQAEEYYLAVKTSRRLCQIAVDWLKLHHPYELPEIVWQEVETTTAYGQWVENEMPRQA